MERSLIAHDRGRPGYTACGLVWRPETSGTLTRCPACALQRRPWGTGLLMGSHPRLTGGRVG